jgi:hypothetical protein
VRAAVFVTLSLCAAIAGADPDPEAQRLLDEGTRLFTEDASYEAAREAFQHSYEIAPSWRALNGIALTYQEQGRFLDAIVTYEKLIAELADTLTPEQRATVDKRRAALDSKVGVVEVAAEQAGAAITLDGNSVGIAPLARPVRVMPGRHVVVATLEGYRPLTRTFDIAAGQRVPARLVLEPERVVVRTAPVQLERRMPRWVPYATLAGSGAVLIAGGVLNLAARASFDEFDAGVAADSMPKSVFGDRATYDRGVLENRLAVGAFVAGGLGAIAGALLVALNQPRPVEVVPDRGVLSGISYDPTQNVPVGGVAFSLVTGSCDGPYYFGIDNTIVPNGTATDPMNGTFAFVNCEPGVVELAASSPAGACRTLDDQSVAPISMTVEPERLTYLGRVACGP